jgi:hypothetical protein
MVVKTLIEILIGIGFNLCIVLDSMDIFTILILSIHEHDIFFYLFLSSSSFYYLFIYLFIY